MRHRGRWAAQHVRIDRGPDRGGSGDHLADPASKLAPCGRALPSPGRPSTRERAADIGLITTAADDVAAAVDSQLPTCYADPHLQGWRRPRR